MHHKTLRSCESDSSVSLRFDCSGQAGFLFLGVSVQLVAGFQQTDGKSDLPLGILPGLCRV